MGVGKSRQRDRLGDYLVAVRSPRVGLRVKPIVDPVPRASDRGVEVTEGSYQVGSNL